MTETVVARLRVFGANHSNESSAGVVSTNGPAIALRIWPACAHNSAAVSPTAGTMATQRSNDPDAVSMHAAVMLARNPIRSTIGCAHSTSTTYTSGPHALSK